MNILISNDDGVNAPGLAMLSESLAEIATIRVVAPDRDRSGASNSLTLTRPLYPYQLNNGYYSVDGTPTDCVYLGMSGLLDIKPEMVVSGINSGANLGDDVLYSGTVAAALEGRFLGVTAIAMSLVGRSATHFKTAAIIAAKLVEAISKLTVAPRTMLNVNVPNLPIDEVKGVRLTRLGHRMRANQLIDIRDPRGLKRYWIAAAGEGEDDGPGTDFFAIKEGYVSVTPLQVDMTRYDMFEPIQQWLDALKWQD